MARSSHNPALLFASAALVFAAMTSPSAAQQRSTARILLYTATADFRHDSIPTAIQALQNQSASAGGTYNVLFDPTEDRTKFNDDNLGTYDAIMFVSTTGEVLDASGKTALQNYLNKGGNFVGVHSASDTLRNDSWFGNEVGAFFDYHPPLQNATVDIIGPSHPSTSMLPAEWHVQDEMYNFKSDPRSVGAVVILSANESSYTDDGVRNYTQGSPHPTAWFQEHGAGVEQGGTAGRSFYTSLGHLNETWRDDLFLAHVMGGVMWTLQANTTKAFNSSGLVGNADTFGSSSGSSSASEASSTSGAWHSPNASLSALLLALIAAFSLMAMKRRL